MAASLLEPEIASTSRNISRRRSCNLLAANDDSELWLAYENHLWERISKSEEEGLAYDCAAACDPVPENGAPVSRPVFPDQPVLLRHLTKSGAVRAPLEHSIARVVNLVSEQALADLATTTLPRLPGKMLVAESIKGEKKESWKERQALAVLRRYIAVNTPDHINFVGLDCDHTDIDRWIKLGLPRPAWVSASKNSGRFHIFWALKTPVDRRATARRKPQLFAQKVYDALVIAMDADPGYAVGALTKNPFHYDWDTYGFNGEAVDLYTLWKVVRPYYKRGARRERMLKMVETGIGRNVDFFWTISYHARDIVDWHRQHGTLETFWQALEQAGLEANIGSMRWKQECLPTLRQIWKWTWTRYFRRSKDVERGVMRLAETSLSVKEKQRLSGPYGARKNKSKSDEKIYAALQQLLEENAEPTQVMLAKRSGVSRSTIVRRWPEIVVKINDHYSEQIASERSKTKCSNGVYQVVRPKGRVSPSLEAPRGVRSDEGAKSFSVAPREEDQSRSDTLPGQTGLANKLLINAPAPACPLRRPRSKIPAFTMNPVTLGDWESKPIIRHPVTGEVANINDGKESYVETVPF